MITTGALLPMIVVGTVDDVVATGVTLGLVDADAAPITPNGKWGDDEEEEEFLSLFSKSVLGRIFLGGVD